MATLTSTGINCSNGTLDGQYTGTTAANTTYPIGSYVLAMAVFCEPLVAVNATASIYTSNTVAADGKFYRSNPGGAGASVIAGTWRSRGCFGNANVMFQRYA